MKKIIFLLIAAGLALLLFSYLFIFDSPSISLRTVSGSGVIQIFISGLFPSITIHSPENTTYNFAIGSTYTLDLNVSANQNINEWWYRLEDKKHNTTVFNAVYFTPNTTFNAVRWNNKLIVFANNSIGQMSNASVEFFIFVPNSAPLLNNISSPILVCEKDALSVSISGSDPDEDTLSLTTSSFDIFFVFPFGFAGATQIQSRFFSGIMNKNNIGTYPQSVSLSDGQLADTKYVNITVIEINNPPTLSDIGVQTIWDKGENRTFYKQVDVVDLEDGLPNGGNLNFTLSFLTGTPFFNITNNGVMNVTGTSSNLGVYNLSVCVIDRGISNIHQNISICGQNGTSSTTCKNFSLTVTDQNRAPIFTSYYPVNLSFNASGTTELFFNITKNDPDGTVPDSYWYVDSNMTMYVTGNITDTFTYTFPCGISGDHNVSVTITDGLLNATLQWNISLIATSCPVSTAGIPPSGGSGGGSIAAVCKENWACKHWSTCQSYNVSALIGILIGNDSISIKEKCKKASLFDELCGFQLRTCFDTNSCNTTFLKPQEINYCEYVRQPSCSDGVKNCHDNDCEVLKDCGGPCPACPSCSDGLKNQGEAGKDCGGPCPNLCETQTTTIAKESVKYLVYLLFIIIIFILVAIVIRLIMIINNKRKEEELAWYHFIVNKKHNSFLFFVLLTLVFLFFYSLGGISAFQSGSSGSANLTIWTNGTQNGANVTYGIIYSKSSADWSWYFFTNFTNSSFAVINSTQGNGRCVIGFNQTGEYGNLSNMSYNQNSFLWEYTNNFSYRGNLTFQANCTSIYGNVTLSDIFTIANTRPWINKSDITGNMAGIVCTEDTLCNYNLSNMTIEDDFNDRALLIFSNMSANTTLTNYTFTSNGFLTINKTNMNQSTSETLQFTVTDGAGSSDIARLQITENSVNDAPIFINLNNVSFNMSSLFNYTILITDEENNTPFNINITFVSCNVAEWSTRNCSTSAGRELFNSSQYTTNGTSGVINITFTPSFNDVGNYIINFSVSDNGSPNSNASKTVNFSVLVINRPPYFRYVCNNERNSTEESPFNCIINVSDVDEVNNLTISANESWFKFNETGLSSAIKNVSINTSYNATFVVNFTANDAQVGNWSINISLRDTGSPLGINSTIISFFITNINDSAILQPLNNITVFTTNNYTVYFNATDDDLLVPDKNFYNESLLFSSNVSWVNVSFDHLITGTNISVGRMNIYGTSAPVGSTSVNISVRDINNFSSSSRTFVITVLGNNAPIWNSSTHTNYTLNESILFYLNLSRNVSDSDGDKLNFSFINTSAFPSFSINLSTGIINFTPVDEDVGHHIINIVVTDGNVNSSLNFNFTVYNLNDVPAIQLPFSVTNGSSDSSSNLNVIEDNGTMITIFIDDDDFRILSGQKSFYNESLTLNVTLVGPNPLLLNFTRDSAFPTQSGSNANRSRFFATFTPNKSDVGVYNLTVNVTDYSNLSSFIKVNFTVSIINHAPVLSAIGNRDQSILEAIYIDINATDIEDKNESALGSNLTFTLINLTARGNFLTVNRTTGIINFTLNQTYAGRWTYNLSVNDTQGAYDSEVFNITVFDYPNIIYPNSSFIYNMSENVTYVLNFSVSHTVNDTLNYTLIINNNNKAQIVGNGNGTSFLWNFTSNFTDETCNGLVNLTLNVSNPKLSNSSSWRINISHTNSPISFLSNIGGSTQLVSAENRATIILSDYFLDVDSNDQCHNQTIGFNYNLINASGGTITISINNWTNGILPNASFSASSAASANYTIYAFEYNESNNTQLLRNISSNNFTVSISISTSPVETPSTGGSGGGGGGGSGAEKIVVPNIKYFKLVLPDPIIADKNKTLLIPITLVNTANVTLNDINVYNVMMTSNGSIPRDVFSVFDKTKIDTLPIGENRTILLKVSMGEKTGNFEILINASVSKPPYSDWGKIFVTIKELETLVQKIHFVEELIIDNPECAEIREIVNEAKRLYDLGEYELSEQKIDEALNACKYLLQEHITFKSFKSLILSPVFVVSFTVLITLAAGIGIWYYLSRRNLLRNAVNIEILRRKEI